MQELEKILEEIEQTQVMLKPFDAEDRPKGIINVDVVKEIIRKHLSGKGINVPTNDGRIPAEECLPEDGTDVLVVLKPTYESDHIEYSIARYLRFENDEAHWCDNHYGYLEWEKYSDGHGGSSWYRVIAWQKLDSYHPERSDNHDGA